jgi:hypothetical protein
MGRSNEAQIAIVALLLTVAIYSMIANAQDARGTAKKIAATSHAHQDKGRGLQFKPPD